MGPAFTRGHDGFHVDVRVGRVSPDEVLALRHRVLRAGRPVETARFSGDLDPGTIHYAASAGGEVVGVASLLRRPFPDGAGPEVQLRGMAVAPELQKSGIGRALLVTIVAEVGEPIWCNARESAVPFYERTGWRICSDRFEIEGAGPHFRMRTG